MTLQPENSLAVQLLELGTSTAGGLGSTPGQGTEVLQAAWYGRKIKLLSNLYIWLLDLGLQKEWVCKEISNYNLITSSKLIEKYSFLITA